MSPATFERGSTATNDWNVIITLAEQTLREARRALARWGRLKPTAYYNVFTMTVGAPDRFLAEFAAAVAELPGLLNFISHAVPAQMTFDFLSAEEFEVRARDIALNWVTRLGSARFHVRLHRRGFKGTLSTPREERFLDDVLLAALQAAGTPGRISFDDPDFVIQIETIGTRAGMSCWSREDLRRFRFLGAA